MKGVVIGLTAGLTGSSFFSSSAPSSISVNSVPFEEGAIGDGSTYSLLACGATCGLTAIMTAGAVAADEADEADRCFVLSVACAFLEEY